MTKFIMIMFKIIELNMIKFDMIEYDMTECKIITSQKHSKLLITFNIN